MSLTCLESSAGGFCFQIPIRLDFYPKNSFIPSTSFMECLEVLVLLFSLCLLTRKCWYMCSSQLLPQKYGANKLHISVTYKITILCIWSCRPFGYQLVLHFLGLTLGCHTAEGEAATWRIFSYWWQKPRTQSQLHKLISSLVFQSPANIPLRKKANWIQKQNVGTYSTQKEATAMLCL